MSKTKTNSVDFSQSKLSNVKNLQCINCKKTYLLEKLIEDQGTTQINICYEGCLGPLAVEFDLTNIKFTKEELLSRPKTFSSIQELLPFTEKNTQYDFNFSELRYSKYYSKKTGLNVYLKLDMNLPSGSFKDRPVLASFKRAKETGYSKVFVASTGNLAISCLRLGKLFNFEVKVYLSNTLNAKRRAYIEQFIDNKEKQLVIVNGSYDDANVRAIKDCENENHKSLKETRKYTTFVPNYTFRPYYKEGSKTSGFETALQLLENKISSDQSVHIFYPLGSGALICSAYKGISELNQLGVFKNQTKFYGVQQETLDPIVKAFKNKTRLSPQLAKEHFIREIAIGNPGSGFETLKVLTETSGGAESVSDREALETFIEFCKNESLFPQLCAALTLRGFEKIHAQKQFKPNDVVVINVTGSGVGKIEDDLLTYSKGLGLEKEIKEIVEV